MTVDDEYGPLDPVPEEAEDIPEGYDPEPAPSHPEEFRTEILDDETVDDDALVEFYTHWERTGTCNDPETTGRHRYKLVEEERAAGPVLSLYFYDDIGHVKPGWRRKGEYPDEMTKTYAHVVADVLAKTGQASEFQS